MYSYDSNGNLCKIDDKLSGQVTTFNYDSQGRLCSYFVNDSESELDQSALYYSYDDESRIKEQHYIRDYNYSGSVYTLTAVSSVSYDVNDGTVSGCDSRIGYYLISAGYTHDDLMRLSGVEYSIGTEDEDYPNTVTQTYDYLTYTDAADDEYESHLISSVTTVFPQNGGTETLNYTYDSNGNITEIRRGTTILCRYEYDDLGQLVREDNSDLGKTYVWDYDAAGNILSKKTYAYTTGTLGSAPSTISYGYSNSTWGDLLISYYGNTITYDAIGNPLSWGDYGELTWQGRRLESYTDSESEETFTYTYNSDGIRTSKTVNGVEHIYHLSGTQILSEEWTENGVQHLLIYIYDASGAPIGMAYRDSTYVSGAFDFYLFAKNVQGDILYIYNTSGTRLVTYTYDAWGNVTTSYSNGGTSTAARYNPFRYRGYYYDTETGFYYLNSRYYDPSVGRFLNADGQLNGTILGYNLFAYCESNPIMWYDPYGYAVNSLFSDERLFSSSFSSSLLGGGGSMFSSSYIYNDIYHTEINPTYDAWSRMQAYDEWFWSSGLNFNSTLYNPSHNAKSDSTSGNSVCFVAGTLVETENGSLPIEAVEEGMRVYSHDSASGKTELKEVVRTFVSESDKLVHIRLNGEEITTTPTHPFYVPQKGWTDAVELRAGDRLQLLNGEYVIIEQVQHELLESPVNVYNFEVADFHTYYVGSTSILVHNKCKDNPFSPDQRALIKLAKEYKGGVNYSEARILVEWANEYGINAHDPMIHPQGSGYWSNTLHIKLFKYHIMVYKE